MLRLIRTKRTNSLLLERMAIHYSQPKGFVGRNICYAIYWNEHYLGHIVFGSATLHLPRNYRVTNLNCIANNLFYNISLPTKLTKYPKRNFTSFVLNEAIKQVCTDWKLEYGDRLTRIESLVEPPRTGELYLKAGFEFIGMTKGFTCKRIGGQGTDQYSGKRVWNTENLRPKLVFCKEIENGNKN